MLPAAIRYLKRTFGEVLEIDAALVRDAQPHETLGIDSLVMMKIIRRLEQDLERLPKTLLFEHRTVEDLARRLVAQFSGPLERVLEIHPAAAKTDSSQIRSESAQAGGPFTTDIDPVTRPSHRGLVRPEIGDSPIAIVGVAGRYPLAPTLDDLWDNLRSGRDCISEIPADRWNHQAYFDPDSDDKGKTFSKWGGFIQDVDRFDALFFGISPREANAMDPQERLFLEIAWATLEDAGYTRQALRDRTRGRHGSDVGVFVGVMHGNYQLFSAAEWGERSPQSEPISLYWSIANRVSYFFDFHGPSLAVDTACSSSLTAVHLACESLRRGECRAALAGGVNLILHPRQYLILSQMKMLSRQPSCRPFGAGADGIVPGEGVGAVLLRPLDDALQDGDRILGIIRGSALNAGGRTGGYTVPNPTAQTELVCAALERSDVDPQTITYLEAHGTGTALGDPIEVAALTKALGSAPRQTCALGSIKSNMGHLEAASGIAGLTKVLLQLRHATIAPTLHCEEPNPNIDLAESPFVLPRCAQPWEQVATPTGICPRRAGISSFGAGGANVHLVLEESPPLPVAPSQPGPDVPAAHFAPRRAQRRAVAAPVPSTGTISDATCRASPARRGPDAASRPRGHDRTNGRAGRVARRAAIAPARIQRGKQPKLDSGTCSSGTYARCPCRCR